MVVERNREIVRRDDLDDIRVVANRSFLASNPAVEALLAAAGLSLCATPTPGVARGAPNGGDFNPESLSAIDRAVTILLKLFLGIMNHQALPPLILHLPKTLPIYGHATNFTMAW